MGKIKANLPFILSFFLVFVVFWVSAAVSLDPDFGWHVQMGKIIQAGGVPKTDQFSYSMPSYPFVDNGWLVSWLLSLLYGKIGYFALAFVFSLLACCSLFLSLNIKFSFKKGLTNARTMYTKMLLLFLGAAIVSPFFGVRPQIFSWLMFSLLFSVLFARSYWNKFKYFLPVLFVAWTNLHGSFAAGIVILFFVVFARFFFQRRIVLVDAAILLLSLAVTFISPYGPGAWGEVLSQITDGNLRWTISEWMPAFFVFSPQLIVLVVLSFLLILRYRRVFGFEILAVYALLLFQGVASVRHIPIWTLFSLPVGAGALDLLSVEANRFKYGSQRLRKLLGFGFLAALVIFFAEFALFLLSGSNMTEQSFYPSQAVIYLSLKPPSGNLFSEYGWGGYLIWKYPQQKVFIDGRMPSWRWEKDIPNEENYVMKAYTEILRGDRSYRKTFEKYNITTVLWPRQRRSSFINELNKKFMAFLRKFGMGREEFDFIDELKKDGWILVYEDSVATIYQRKI